MNNLNPSDIITRFETAAKSLYGDRGWQIPAAEATGISQGMLSKLTTGATQNPRNSTVEKLAAGLFFLEQIKSGAVIEQARVLNDAINPEVSERIEALRKADPILAEIEESFEIAREIVDGAIKMVIPAVIITAAPGVGKSFGIIRQIRAAGVPHDIMTGSCSAPGLFQTLWKLRKGGLLLADDCDEVMGDEDTINILKAALNSENRFLSYRKNGPWVFKGSEAEYDAKIAECKAVIARVDAIAKDEREEDDMIEMANAETTLKKIAEQVPQTFEYKGSVVFISNKDFDAEIERGTSISCHLAALQDRAIYLNLELDTTEKLVTRVRQGIDQYDILGKYEGIDAKAKKEILEFVVKYADSFKGISFRLAEKIAGFYVSGPMWKTSAARTQFKRGKKL